MNARLTLILVAALALALGATGGYFAGRQSGDDPHPRHAAANVYAPETVINEGVKPGNKEPGSPANSERPRNPEPPPGDPTLKGCPICGNVGVGK